MAMTSHMALVGGVGERRRLATEMGQRRRGHHHWVEEGVGRGEEEGRGRRRRQENQGGGEAAVATRGKGVMVEAGVVAAATLGEARENGGGRRRKCAHLSVSQFQRVFSGWPT